MIKVLCVDDDNERIRSIASILPEGKVEYDHVMTKNEAFKKLSKQYYDLVIIDIMLPNNIDEPNPNQRAGIELIQAFDRRKIFVPSHIVGVTSDEETYAEYEAFFNARLFPIIRWDPINDSDWVTKMTNIMEHLYLVETKSKDGIKIDIAIITAVEEEFIAVKSCYKNWRNLCNDSEPGSYFYASSYDNEGQPYTVLLTLLPEMGLTAASNVTTKIINKYAPNKVFMVGICGGIKGQVELGDLVIANTTWDYGSGKIKPRTTDKKGYYIFEPSPNQVTISPAFNKLKFTTDTILKELTDAWNEHHQDSLRRSKLHIGPMPSGASVICDKSLFEEIVKPQHRKCLALDMETYGVYYACKNTTNVPIEFLSVKSVSDYADEEKNDDYHDFCCYLSANYLKCCIDSRIL